MNEFRKGTEMALSKHDIRQYCRQIREKLSTEQVASYSQQICHFILQQPIFQESEHIGLFMPMPKEVQLQSLLKLPKQFYLPVVQPNMHLHFHAYLPNTPLIKNKWGIDEPSQTLPKMDIQHLEIIFLPMLAYNQHGYRLGMGKGCFDRTLSTKQHGFLIGVAFDIQQFDGLNIEPHDIPMDMIITEKRVLEF